MNGYWAYKTRAGTFMISEQPGDGRFHAIFDGESLGSYFRPEQAADDLAGGHTYSPSSGLDTSRLGISADLGDWVFMRK
jgi:hypothetical protein